MDQDWKQWESLNFNPLTPNFNHFSLILIWPLDYEYKFRFGLWVRFVIEYSLCFFFSPDSPLLWLRFDPDLLIIRSLRLQQQDYCWQLQLKYERDVVAQLQALERLPEMPTMQTRFTLSEAVENDHGMFYRIRVMACDALAEVANKMTSNWSGPPAMLLQFRKMFSSLATQHIVRLNNFNNFKQYFVQQVRESEFSINLTELQVS